MAQFSDIYNTYGPTPASWQMYPLELQGDDLRTQVGLNAFQAQRDFTQYDLPDLLSSFAAKGTFASGRRQRDAGRLGERVVENLGSQFARAGISLSDLDTSKVGAAIGAQF